MLLRVTFNSFFERPWTREELRQSHFANAASLHSLYWPATSASFDVVAAKVLSLSGVRGGQEASIKGFCRLVSRKNGVEHPLNIITMTTINIDWLKPNFTF